jgi:drug/metabolite transporter (DMT)-like permease
MSGIRVLGIVLAVVGAVILVFGLNASHSLVDQASQTFIGRYTQGTMAYIIVGLAALVAGALMALVGRR